MKRILLFLVILLTILPTWAKTKPKIYVGGYAFAPYVEETTEGHFYGLTLDVIDELNAVQSEFHFQFVPTSIEKRHQAFALGRFDMVIFENPEWGWLTADVNYTPLNIEDGERYIALKEKATQLNFFDNLEDKNILLVRGYHYSLLNWKKANNDTPYRIQYVSSTKALIENILKRRGDLAPVTDSYLRYYLKTHPEKQNKLVISSRWEQHYFHNIILRNHSKLPQAKLEQFIKLLSTSGKISHLVQKYGLKQSPTKINDSYRGPVN